MNTPTRGESSSARPSRFRLWISLLIGLLASAVAGAQMTYEVVHKFRESGGPAPPDVASHSRLIVGADSSFYGTTYWGGTAGFGTIYRTDSAGHLTTLHSFAFIDGANPAAGLVLSSDGDFYGTTSLGGTNNLGTVFRMTPEGALTTIHTFDGNDGQRPLASLMQASDGLLYGTTSAGGAHGNGTVFRIDSSGVIECLQSFDSYVNGARPVAELLEANGHLYGSTSEGGANNLGTLFRMSLNGELTTIHVFEGPDGKYPSAALIQAASGDLYGTTREGGGGLGSVFRVDAADQLFPLHGFNYDTEGGYSSAPLVQGADGAFYGTNRAGSGVAQYGTVFRITNEGTTTILHFFDGIDGGRPAVGLVEAPDGALCGATTSFQSWNASTTATLFRISSDGEFAVIHRFGSLDGTGPAYLLQASDGYIYGTTARGGTKDLGTVFRLNPSAEVTELHNFEGGLDGRGPANLIEASDGSIYGTDWGGANDLGRIFRLDPSGTTTTLHSFDGNDGAGSSGLVQSSEDGLLYGTTPDGAFFRIDTSGNFESLGGFSAEICAYPNGPLVEGNDGHFFGTARGPGDGCQEGCVFDIRVGGDLWITYKFGPDGTEGVYPVAPLADADGLQWGTTFEGAEGFGTIFMTAGGSFNLDTVHVFDGATEGGNPVAALLAGGWIYGTASIGGPAGKGTIFQMDDSGNFTVLYAFPGAMDGGNPVYPLIGASDGYLYGTAGVIYRLTDHTIAANQLMPTSGPSSAGSGLIVIGGGFGEDTTATVGGAAGSDMTRVGSTFVSFFTPPLSPGTLNDVSVTVPDGVGTATSTLASAFFADFLDVPQIDPFHDYVEKIVRKGITAGCGGGNYCPQDAVTRAQMAVFLLKSKHGSTYAPPSCTGVFADVPCPSLFADWIEQLAAEGITAGCGDGNYCPTNPVTRAQMAVFLLKTNHGPGYAPPACTGVFGDVACPSLFADWIEELAAEGITGGCGGGNYCPDNPNTRAQMSAFLVKTFGM